MGGFTRAGIALPGTLMDKHDKDTVVCRVLDVGPPPWTRDLLHEHSWDYVDVEVDDLVIVPRDVPLVIVHGEKRYGIVHTLECMALLEGADPDWPLIEQGYEQVPRFG